MSRRLNPCPFCGTRPKPPCEYTEDPGDVVDPPRAVICEACSAQGPFIDPNTGEECTTEAAARVAWNSRA